jgi:membrane associated rhomboid family serine protease
MLAPMSTGSELSVVCKNCGSEVSPYVTECPYCGVRLRKRAPKLRREGDRLQAKVARRARISLPAIAGSRPYATLAAIVVPLALLLAQHALDRPLADFGAIDGSPQVEWWRYLAAPFAYTDVGYLFVVAVVLALFAAPLEQRLGTPTVLVLLLACGGLGVLAADGVESLLDAEGYIAAGGNGVALGALAGWFAIRRDEARRLPTDEIDTIGVAVIAVVLLALPVVDDWANVWAGLAGGAVGALAGLITSRLIHNQED